MVLLLRAGQEVPIEPAIFTDLALNGKRDARPFLDAIAAQSFLSAS
jgi:hypothetical protein